MTETPDEPLPASGQAATPKVPVGWPYRCIGLLIGCMQLADGIARVERGAWLSGSIRVGLGVAFLSVVTVFWARTGSQIRPVSQKQQRSAAWMIAHPVQMSIAMGLPFGLMGGTLFGLTEGGWPVSMAFWLPGGLVFGLLMVREIGRRIPPANGTALDRPLSTWL